MSVPTTEGVKFAFREQCLLNTLLLPGTARRTVGPAAHLGHRQASPTWEASRVPRLHSPLPETAISTHSSK